jgi:putative tricarboxylic transport membrane protein
MKIMDYGEYLVAAFVAAPLALQPAAAQEIKYPVDTVTLIVHTSAGGGTDVFLREAVRYLEPIMGVKFVIQNMPGGAGAKAMTYLEKAPKDGSVLLGVTGTFVNTSVTTKLETPYDALQPVVRFFLDPSVVYVRADSPIKTMKDLVEYARANPGKLKYGLATPTSQDRYGVEQLQKIENIQINAVAFESGGDLQISVLNGTLDVANGEPQEIKAQLEAGKIRAIGMLTEQRITALPDLPTAKEQGVNLSMIKFRGLTGPKGLPDDVLKAWEIGAKKLLEDPGFKKYYEEGGLIPAVQNSAEFTAFIDEFAKTQTQFFTDIGVIK